MATHLTLDLGIYMSRISILSFLFFSVHRKGGKYTDGNTLILLRPTEIPVIATVLGIVSKWFLDPLIWFHYADHRRDIMLRSEHVQQLRYLALAFPCQEGVRVVLQKSSFDGLRLGSQLMGRMFIH